MFQLIFVDNLENIAIELLKGDKKLSIGLLLKECICKCAEEGYIEKENIDVIHNLLGSSIHGKLLFLVNKRDGKSSDDMLLVLKSEFGDYRRINLCWKN